MSIEWKPIEFAHVTAWAELSNLIARCDGDDEHCTPDDLVEELREPRVDPRLDTIGAWDEGEMVAYGQLRLASHGASQMTTAFLAGGVHPGRRRQGLGTAVMEWIEPRAERLALGLGSVRGTLSLWAGRPGSSAARLAEARGYLPSHFFHDLRLELTAWPAVRTPIRPRRLDGSGLRLPLDATDPVLVEGVRRAHHDAFAEHRNAAPRDPEFWAAQLAGSTFRPHLSRVALAPSPGMPLEDAVDAYVLSGEYEPGELYVCLVGTRRRARGRGLATVLLQEVLASAKAAGFTVAALSVDAEPGTGVTGLYLPLGFEVTRTDVVYERPMQAIAGARALTARR